MIVWVDYLRLFAVFAVVLSHTCFRWLDGAEFGTYDWWIAGTFYASFRWSVPIFLMISGFLLLDSQKKYAPTEFYRRRLMKTILPLFFWSVFYLFLRYEKKVVKNEAVSISVLVSDLLHGTPEYHMWYLFMLPTLYLAVPFVHRLLVCLSEKEADLFCTFLLGLTFVSQLCRQFPVFGTGKTLFINMFVEYLGYFVLGHCLGRSQFGARLRLIHLFSILLIIVMLMMLTRYVLSASGDSGFVSFLFSFNSPTVLALSICIFLIFMRYFNLLPYAGVHRLGGTTLGVYLVHPVFLSVFGKSLAGFDTIFALPLTSAVVFALSISFVLIVQAIPYIRRII